MQRREIPILFQTEMVQAILAGRKTQTRRVVKPQPHAGVRHSPFTASGVEDGHGRKIKSPFGYPGDVLWVREAWNKDVDDQHEPFIRYKANYKSSGYKWKPSIHMPKAACRIYLEVTEVRLERLHDISEEDAVAEGIEVTDGKLDDSPVFRDYTYSKPSPKTGFGYPVHSFESLWDAVNGPGTFLLNPWVWVVSFKVLSTTGRPAMLDDTMEQAVEEYAERVGTGKHHKSLIKHLLTHMVAQATPEYDRAMDDDIHD